MVFVQLHRFCHLPFFVVLVIVFDFFQFRLDFLHHRLCFRLFVEEREEDDAYCNGDEYDREPETLECDVFVGEDECCEDGLVEEGVEYVGHFFVW